MDSEIGFNAHLIEEEKEDEWMDQKEDSSVVITELTDSGEKKVVNLEMERTMDRGKGLYIDQPNTTQRFNEIQARLGYDKPSKVLDWLMDAAAHAIPVSVLENQYSQLELEDLNFPLFPRVERINQLRNQDVPRDCFEGEQEELTLSLRPPEIGSNFGDDKEDGHIEWLSRGRGSRLKLNQATQQEEAVSLLSGVESGVSNSVRDDMLIAFRKFLHKRNSNAGPRNSACHSSVGSNVRESYGSNSVGAGAERDCSNCLLYCGIFPRGYEIDRDTLIQLWMAAGFISLEPMEDVAADYLHVLEVENIISTSRKDPSSGKEWYKINKVPVLEDMLSGVNHVKVDSANPIPVPTAQGGPCHVTVQYSSADLEVLKSFAEMRTLLFLKHHGSRFERVPDDFFISLKHLRVLDFSDTRLIELPSSICNAECLAYLDLSHTLIKQLPETIRCLQFLWTLKLRKCPRLIALPKGITKLNRLQHLEFDSPSSACSMPPGIGTLTNLRTLLEFPVGKEYGCSIQELKNMNDLRGSLCLSRLEHIVSLDEAREANLFRKQMLKKLELGWSRKKRRDTGSDEDIIKYLRPHTNLQILRILCYGGSAFPTWISDPSFVNLVSITLFKCENCRLLPSLGQLPSLESLCLYELTAVRMIDFHFYQDIAIADGNDVAFPSLLKLEIISMLSVESFSDPEIQNFPRLVEMTIKDCPKLASLWRLSGLCSLKYLEINNCSVLSSLPEGNLSIETLVIEGCPSLGSSCLKEDGEDRHKVVLVPNVFIDQLGAVSPISEPREF